MPPVLEVKLFQCLAFVKIRLSPDPRLVRAAHLRFHIMDPADIFPSPLAEQEWADRQVIMGNRIAHFNNNEIAELIGFQLCTVHPCTIAFTCRKVLQDILPFLLDPAEDILSCWCDTSTNYLTAEPALLTQLIFSLMDVH